MSSLIGKGFLYSLPSVGPGADLDVTGSQSAGDCRSFTWQQVVITFR